MENFMWDKLFLSYKNHYPVDVIVKNPKPKKIIKAMKKAMKTKKKMNMKKMMMAKNKMNTKKAMVTRNKLKRQW
jgi:Ni,Fe-hydrogenase III small subunit